VAKKLNLRFILLYLRYMWREGFGWKRRIGGGGEVGWKFQYTVIYGGRGLKLLKKPSCDIWTFSKCILLHAYSRTTVSAQLCEKKQKLHIAYSTRWHNSIFGYKLRTD